MRRRDRLLSEAETLSVIRAAPHAVIATADRSGMPYSAQVSPALAEGFLYFHTSSAPEGRLYQNLMQNPNAAFSFTAYSETALDELPDELSVNYASAFISGKVSQVTEPEEKKRIAMQLASRHVPPEWVSAAEKIYDSTNKAMTVWKLEIQTMTGKARNKQRFFGQKKLPDCRE